MNISICITVFNERKTIAPLIESLLKQSLKAHEIVIVDGGSKDDTVKIIKDFQKKNKYIKLIQKKCTRAEGRNIGIKSAKNQIIAITDAGCTLHRDWLKNITKPFKNKSVDVSAGFYKMVGKAPIQKAMSIFLGVTPKNFKNNFLPSTRSMAFTKKAWKVVGGFPEGRENSAEDTDFNYKAVKFGLKYARVKTAIAEWGMPAKLSDFQFKIYTYALWDARYGIWWHPAKGLASHNIKASFIVFRYFAALLILILAFKNIYLFPIFGFLILLYVFWSYRKVYKEFGENKVAIYGPVLQIASDLAVSVGLLQGLTEV